MSSLIDHFGINWSSVAERSLSVLIYLILQVLKVSDKNQNIIFKACNLSKSRTAKFWLTKYLNQEYDGLHNDGRGGQRNDFFYDIYPDIESEAKLYAMTCAEEKSCSFTVLKLAEYITDLYVEETGEHFEENELVRSESSCHRDLIRWGFYLGSNSNRPYFEGHERAYVVAVRNQVVEYFTLRKHLYYTLTQKDEVDNIEYVIPIRQEDGSKRVTLFSHDESTIRSGEISKKMDVS